MTVKTASRPAKADSPKTSPTTRRDDRKSEKAGAKPGLPAGLLPGHADGTGERASSGAGTGAAMTAMLDGSTAPVEPAFDREGFVPTDPKAACICNFARRRQTYFFLVCNDGDQPATARAINPNRPKQERERSVGDIPKGKCVFLSFDLEREEKLVIDQPARLMPMTGARR